MRVCYAFESGTKPEIGYPGVTFAPELTGGCQDEVLIGPLRSHSGELGALRDYLSRICHNSRRQFGIDKKIYFHTWGEHLQTIPSGSILVYLSIDRQMEKIRCFRDESINKMDAGK
ncbi:unnamed protein product [Pieris macdunnoughi]|uniref:Uncharacterized protein n=1 Tax=Pieris macdunnoughi TaxID=345717 RepID=A0A821S6Q0_9NEOP|nr:unnamed protein product [Pieris macdunnoughi]